ncbi:hypothetical protein RHGRI_032288 [Rhododendron griersonianum]|uniref:WAT1-related protein n=1 Tax=Rhododendron griersonianum TaxID=479676 RepID=A0AAV6IDP3_9ERIC|nr:hypothetical protein RHGRI_032288 [Rhododendron griersonianum]
MGRISNTIQGLKPAMMMVTVQAALAGVNIFYKLAGNNGMSLSVLIAYRFIFAAAFIVPLALVVERKTRPKLTWVVICQAFLCGLLGMERLGFGTWAGKAKVVGTLLCIAGAMLLTFYKGAEINIWSTSVDLLHKGPNHGGHAAASHQKAGNPALGALLAVCCCFSLAMGLIVQAKMMRNYPCPYSSTAIMITFGAIQATVFALCMERDWSQWELGWDIKLLTVSYTGIVASGAMFTFMAWCVQMRGPLFVSVFNPLMLVLVALAGSLVLDEKLHLGTVLGAVVIIFGLYTVLWGKGKELKRITQLMPSKSSRESERIEIIISSSAENSININSSSRSSILVVIPNDVSMAYTLDDALDDGVSETNKAKEEEDNKKEGEQEDANYDDKGKGYNLEATAPKD